MGEFQEREVASPGGIVNHGFTTASGRIRDVLFRARVVRVRPLDTSALRAKFGSPLNRETFHIPPGFDLVVDYGPSNQVCRLEVPALMPIDEKVEKVQNSAVMEQRMYDFLAEVVPPSIRGN